MAPITRSSTRKSCTENKHSNAAPPHLQHSSFSTMSRVKGEQLEASSPHLEQSASRYGTITDVENEHAGASLPHLQPSNPDTLSPTIESEHLEASSLSQVQLSDSGKISHSDELIQSRPSEFTLFPKLPTELRLRVWSFAMFPRVVSFVPGGGKAPGVLSACRESRKETRKLYHLCIHIPSSDWWQVIRDMPEFGVFINYDVDIIYFTPCSPFIEDVYRLRTTNTKYINGGGPDQYKVDIYIPSWVFPLWAMPAKRVALHFHGTPTNDIDWLWSHIFRQLPENCPLINEILILQHNGQEIDAQKMVEMQIDDQDLERIAYQFQEAEAFVKLNGYTIQDLETEEDFLKNMVELIPWDRCWFTKPKLTFVRIEK